MAGSHSSWAPHLPSSPAGAIWSPHRCDCSVLSFTGLGLCLLLQRLKGFLDLGYIFWHCLQPVISGLDAALDRAKATLGLPDVSLNSFPNTLLLVLESLYVPHRV